MAWQTALLKGAGNLVKTGTGMAVYGTGKLAMGVARNPVAALRLAGLGWGGVVIHDWATNDKGLLESAADHMPDKLADKTARPLNGAIESVEEIAHTGKEAIGQVIDAGSSVAEWFSPSPSGSSAPGQTQTGNPIMDTISGIGTFFRNMFSGNGGNMFSNFLGNAMGGQVGMGSTLGLIAAGIMLFRGGFMGKLFGGLLAAGILGSNSILPQQRIQQQLAQGNPQTLPQAPAIIPAAAVQVFHHPTDEDKVLLRGTSANGQVLPEHELLKERYDVMHNNGISDIQIFNDLQQTPNTYAQHQSQGMAR